jgi:hypothetical protein
MTTYDSFHNFAFHSNGTIVAGHFNEPDRYMTSRPSGRGKLLGGGCCDIAQRCFPPVWNGSRQPVEFHLGSFSEYD